jgi:hypothetical protein
MVKVLILSYEFPPLGGGGAKIVQGLTNELVKEGTTAHVITAHGSDVPGYNPDRAEGS